jgi:DNA repair exonuclease SbcCD ATPase subunit
MPPKIKVPTDTNSQQKIALEPRRAKIEAIQNMSQPPRGPRGGDKGEKDKLSELISLVQNLTTRFDGFETELKSWQTTWTTRVQENERAIREDINPGIVEAKRAAKDAIEAANKAQATVRTLGEQLNKLKTEVNTWQDKHDTLQNLKDREYKEKNMRILGLQEAGEREITKKTVFGFLSTIYTDLKLENLEYAYRVGRPNTDGSPRPAIVRFKDKQLRNKVYIAVRRKNLTDIKVTDDLTKADLELRNQALPQMRYAIKHGKKAFFTKGKLKINGKYVKIDPNSVPKEEDDNEVVVEPPTEPQGADSGETGDAPEEK